MKTFFKIELKIKGQKMTLRTEGTDIGKESRELLDWANEDGLEAVKFTGLWVVEQVTVFGGIKTNVRRFRKTERSQLASL